MSPIMLAYLTGLVVMLSLIMLGSKLSDDIKVYKDRRVTISLILFCVAYPLTIPLLFWLVADR